MKRLAFDAGWMRWGWPERVGGLGGSTPAARLPRRGADRPRPRRARHLLDDRGPGPDDDRLRRRRAGGRRWCRGCCGATRPGARGSPSPAPAATSPPSPARPTRTDDGWRVNGQKVWTSLAQYAQRCVLLTRTGTPESAHRGITALFVDMDTPGITVRPIETIHGRAEFCEVFFDDVRRARRPHARRRGPGLGGGHGPAALRAQHRAVAPRRLPAPARSSSSSRPPRRGRAAGRPRSARRSSSSSPSGPGPAPRSTGWPRATRSAPRRRSTRCCWPPPSRRCSTSPLDGLADDVLLGDDPASERWRSEFLYSRAATIYGGSAEIQRNIVARRLLDLGADR